MPNPLILTAWLCFALLTAPAQARELTNWQAAMLSGSGKLGFYALMQTRPKGSDRYLTNFMRRDGLAHKTGTAPQLLHADFAISPLLGYDNNLNNGIPGSEFSLGEMNLVVNPDSVAKKGVTFGLAVAGSRRYSLAPRQVLTFKGAARYEYAPKHDLDKSGITASSCLQSHVAKWSWLQACGGYRYFKKSTVLQQKYLSLGGTQMFASGLGYYQVDLSFERAKSETYIKSKAALGLLSAIPAFGALYTGLHWGEEVPGHHTSVQGASISLTRPIWGKTTTLSLSYNKAAGGSHFGQPRSDRAYTMMIKRPVSNYLVVRLGYQINRSNIDLYQGNQALFGIDLKPWRF